ncbi:MAG: cytochrome c-type biogenesis protein CcmH [Candidatus Dadabacteria bacterium]
MTLTSTKKYTGITTLALTVLFLFSAAAIATEKSLDDRVNEIAYLLMCPVCQGQSVAESNSNLANDMRQIIRKQLEEGKTNQEVIDYFVSSYGDSILASPPKKGINWLLWVMPGVAVVLGAVGIALFLHKSKRPEDEVEFIPAAPGEESESEYLKKVDEELKKYE